MNWLAIAIGFSIGSAISAAVWIIIYIAIDKKQERRSQANRIKFGDIPPNVKTTLFYAGDEILEVKDVGEEPSITTYNPAVPRSERPYNPSYSYRPPPEANPLHPDNTIYNLAMGIAIAETLIVSHSHAAPSNDSSPAPSIDSGSSSSFDSGSSGGDGGGGSW